LRARKAETPVFRRQHPIDGMTHDLGDPPQRDASRDAWLKARGLAVMRIAASEAMRNADKAADAIVNMATEMIRASAPSTAP
jgi:very-short-patch-repair endonuclease